jgi:hypothetical protein
MGPVVGFARHFGLAGVIVLAWVGSARAQCVTAGDSCSDGLYCTVGDTCDASLACVGTARDCRDGITCTDDVCNESADRCDHPPDAAGSACSDGDYCTEPDTCDGAGDCVSGPPRDCDDDRDCTTDSCDEASDTCDHSLVTGCLIRGTCVADGATNPDNPCEACVPSTVTNRYEALPVGAACGAASCDMGSLTPAPTCDAAGACSMSAASPCPSGLCLDTLTCAECAGDGDCAPGERCDGNTCVAAVPDGGSPGIDGGPSPADGGPSLGDGGRADGGRPEIGLVAHGTGCIACAVTPLSAVEERRARLALALVALACLVRVRRRR